MRVLKTNSKTTTKYLGLLLAWLFTLTLALPAKAQVANSEIEKENDSTAVDSLWSDSAVVKTIRCPGRKMYRWPSTNCSEATCFRLRKWD